MIKSTFRLSALLPLGLTLLLTTAACTRTPDAADVNGTDPTADTVDPIPGDQVEDTESLLALSGEGLQLVGDQTGSTNTLAFGTDMVVVENVLTELVGEPIESGENTECGSGPQMITQWPNGLVLHAADGEFIGWSARPDTDASLTTIAGVGTGSTRGELEAAYTVEVTETSLGTEFSTGSLFGLLSSTEPDATITDLWAGTVCNFR
ncbi:hypothetical protein IQ273_28235 [Nodosilinea sp. LEGE 07298]|uniref:hypothetical protein n=1 Tax=Nodosilinea sp. LEGE 07298 TaxID=2777970 RepID=UPI001881901D|nr:hypothetical protein [Nodosilinea sp. LEGE 07298]MBE9113271.1 hypothetical protein [Nodosilinea sp. LEGE 07298]